MDAHPTFKVMALHALEYCERLFYLEEVEGLYVQDEHVFAGRTLHEALDEDGDFVQFTHESETLGLRGRLDALRTRDGQLIPYEHKRGHSRDGTAWPTDRLQLGAYALLLEEASGEQVETGRIRYHADKKLVHVAVDETLRGDVARAVLRARELSVTVERPPVAVVETLCGRCSLAPVCLPEETRKALDARRSVVQLHPRDDERTVLHVSEHGTRVGKRGDELVVTPLEGSPTRVPIRSVRSVTCHGAISVSAQALDLCADHGIAVHWFSVGGWYSGSFQRDDDAVQRRIRQYEALREPAFRLMLARRLVEARMEGQLRFVLRATRTEPDARARVEPSLAILRESIASVWAVETPASLLGYEGRAAAAYFAALPALLNRSDLGPAGRTRRPPEDPFNALLGFGYAMLLREVHQAIRTVGLEPAFGFYHQPRTGAPPLALDLLELFRVPCVDMAVVAAVNRGQFDPERDFQQAGRSVWLKPEAKRRAIMLFEERMKQPWKHPVLEYSLSYRRHIELEVRLIEKEWSGEAGLFARARLR